MDKTIHDRVTDSFDDSDHEDITKYADWALNLIGNASQNLRRIVTLMLLLIAIFEIIAQSPKMQVSIGAFRITRDSVIFTFIPALIAYLYLQIILDTARISKTSSAFEAAFRKWSSKAADNGLEVFIAPTMPIYWNFGVDLDPALQGPDDRIENLMSTVFAIGVLIGILAFEGQAFYVLFSSDLTKDISWFISVCISLIFSIFGIIYFFKNNDT